MDRDVDKTDGSPYQPVPGDARSCRPLSRFLCHCWATGADERGAGEDFDLPQATCADKGGAGEGFDSLLTYWQEQDSDVTETRPNLPYHL